MADVEKLRKVKQCIDSLADGLDPFTGRPLAKQEIVNDVRVTRSLFFVSALLQEQLQKAAKKAGKKQAFRMSLEQRQQVEFSGRPITASELARRMNCAADTQDCQKIGYRQITDWLVDVGMLQQVESSAGGPGRRPTEMGERMGIFLEQRTGKTGMYQVVVYTEEAQHFVVDNVDAIVSFAQNKEKEAPSPGEG